MAEPALVFGSDLVPPFNQPSPTCSAPHRPKNPSERRHPHPHRHSPAMREPSHSQLRATHSHPAPEAPKQVAWGKRGNAERSPRIPRADVAAPEARQRPQP